MTVPGIELRSIVSSALSSNPDFLCVGGVVKREEGQALSGPPQGCSQERWPWATPPFPNVQTVFRVAVSGIVLKFGDISVSED